MPLTESEKEKIRYHTGYMETSFAASMQLGIPRPVQTVFLLESAMSLLTNEDAVNRVRGILAQLERLEEQLKSATCSLVAEQVGDLKLRANFPDLLEKEYVRWAKRLADILGTPLYAYSTRFQRSGPGRSIPVM
jgi:hypothetical protein